MEITKEFGVLNYDARNIFIFEVYPDGHTNRVYNDRSSINHKDDDSSYCAYFRAKNKECTLYVAFSNTYGETKVLEICNLEAFADSLGIVRPTDHIHKINWSFNKADDGKSRYATIDIEFLCGCTISSQNIRIIAQQFREQFGWQVVMNSVHFSIPQTKATIQVERNSIKTPPNI